MPAILPTSLRRRYGQKYSPLPTAYLFCREEKPSASIWTMRRSIRSSCSARVSQRVGLTQQVGGERVSAPHVADLVAQGHRLRLSRASSSEVAIVSRVMDSIARS